jgi:short-subunit dehydrogenase
MIWASGGTAVVTGAAGGLGAALGEALRARGLRVVGTDVRAARGVDELLDVSDAEACRELARRHRPVIWVNNAGVLAAGHAATQPLDDVRRCVEVNLLGTVNGARAAAEVMVPAGRGRILNIGSLASWVPVPGEAVYAASKHAVRAFSLGLAAELAGTRVRVQLLCPDGIWTPMLHGRLDDPDAAMSFTALRLLEPAEVAREAIRLLESRSLIRSVPRLRGAQVRVLGAVPGGWLRLTPALRRIGRFRQGRVRRRQTVAGQVHENQEAR